MPKSFTFPGVYTSVTDNSQIPQLSSRFTCGLIGVTQKGPFNTPIAVTSLSAYQRAFGGAVTGSFIPQAAAVVSALSDGVSVIRVGNQYTPISLDGTGTKGQTKLNTSLVNRFSAGQYVQVSATGTATTSNAKIVTVGSNFLTLDTALAANYFNAQIGSDPLPNAAASAEGFLSALNYGTPIQGNGTNTSAVGNKGAYTVTLNNAPINAILTGGSSPINVGDIIKIDEPGKKTTGSLRVKNINLSAGSLPTSIDFDSTTVSSVGYQPLALQDTYTSASTIYVASQSGGAWTNLQTCTYVTANSAGTWANGSLVINVGPGSISGTKRFYVYLGGSLAETIDNLTFSDSTDPNYVETRINGKSNYITVKQLLARDPASTLSGWAVGGLAINNVTLSGGFDGNNPSDADYIGTYDTVADTYTGLQIFSDINEIDVYVICAPGVTSAAVIQEGAIVASKSNSEFFLDVPKDLNSRDAVDWHNGQGLFSGTSTKINNRYASVFWNWFSIVDPFDGTVKFVPPSIGALRAHAYTFDSYKPWYAAAGEKRGQIVEAIDVQYKRIIDPDAIYGNGNSVNPIVVFKNVTCLYGNRTLQRTETKLTEIHNMILVNYLLKNMSALGRQFVFDPNDSILLSQLKSVYTQFLQSVQNDRGIEAFRLVCDASNNTADDRNRRQVNVDFEFIPTSSAERIYLNATVDASGVVLNNIGTTSA